MAYTAAVTSPMVKAERISRSFGFFAGKCNVTDYGSGTLIETTAITKHFKACGVSGFTHGLIAVIPTGMSDAGYSFEWDYTTGAFHAYTPSAVASWSGSIPVNSGAPGSALAFDSGGGVAKLQADSAVGNIVFPVAAAAAPGAEESGATDVGEVGFIAIGFV